MFALLSHTSERYGVPRYVTHLTNKIMILTDKLSLPNVTARKETRENQYIAITQHQSLRLSQQPTGIPLQLRRPSSNKSRPSTPINNVNMTSGHFSRFFIQDPKPVYAIGDRIKIVIETRTDRNAPKTAGGDFIRAKMFSLDDRASQSTDGEVTDLGNGWYEAWFTARWPGVTTIQLVLVHTAEAFSVLRDIVQNPAKMVYIGRFVSGNSDVSVTTKCNMYPPLYGQFCNMSEPDGRMPWFCQAPSKAGISCDDWRWSQSDEPATSKLLDNLIGHPSRQTALRRYREQIENGGIPLNIKVELDATLAGTYNANPFEYPWQNLDLPPCQPGQHIGKPHPSGYFYNDTWYSLQCRIRRHWLPGNMSSCLANTDLQIIGDSAARQIYTLLKEMLQEQITIERSGFLHESEHRSGPLWFIDYNNGIEVRYNFHGFPIGGSNWFNISNIMDATTRIDMIQNSTRRLILVLTIAAHFTYHNLDFYEARMRSVKGAIDRLFERVPNTMVIMKSLTAREFATLRHIAANSEWWMWSLDRTMRKIFGNDPRIALIDAWDMTKAMLFSYNIHPHRTIIANYISQILTFVCPTSS
ncbi:NXPE family member 3-like [Lytechinus pictus]|uniref:NXPE family member 3-like n=1 Tax=Lytechinus pictus TaxID=7653 RepID=UPI0030B9D202